MSDGMGRELAYLSSHATNRYFIPNWGIYILYRAQNVFFILKMTKMTLTKMTRFYLNLS